jgi:RNA polymerase sigma-70 factor (ECF subfamily)
MDAETFRSVVEQERHRLFSFAVYMLRDAEEARDVAQESLVRLWKNRARVPAPAAARAWLTRTAHNLCIDVLRARGQHGSAGPERMDETASPEPGPERGASAGELRRDIARALGDLPQRDRAILIMREVQGLAYEEIASALRMPLGTLKATLHRARHKLRDLLVERGVTP